MSLGIEGVSVIFTRVVLLCSVSREYIGECCESWYFTRVRVHQ
jgi:hypothetical protein